MLPVYFASGRMGDNYLFLGNLFFFSVYFASLFPAPLRVFCYPFHEEDNKSACRQDRGSHRSPGFPKTSLSHRRPRRRRGKGWREQAAGRTKLNTEIMSAGRGTQSGSHRLQGSFYELFQRNRARVPAGGAGNNRERAAPETCRPWDGGPSAGRELRSHLGAGLLPSCSSFSSRVPDFHLRSQTV